MTTKKLRRIRYMRAAGYLLWVATGLLTFWGPVVHILDENITHMLSGLLILGGLLAAFGELTRRFAFEVAGLYLLIGGVSIFAALLTGRTILNDFEQSAMAMFTIGVAVLLAGRVMDLKHRERLAIRWGDIHVRR